MGATGQPISSGGIFKKAVTSPALYQSLFDTAVLSIVQTDLDGRIVEAQSRRTGGEQHRLPTKKGLRPSVSAVASLGIELR